MCRLDRSVRVPHQLAVRSHHGKPRHLSDVNDSVLANPSRSLCHSGSELKHVSLQRGARFGLAGGSHRRCGHETYGNNSGCADDALPCHPPAFHVQAKTGSAATSDKLAQAPATRRGRAFRTADKGVEILSRKSLGVSATGLGPFSPERFDSPVSPAAAVRFIVVSFWCAAPTLPRVLQPRRAILLSRASARRASRFSMISVSRPTCLGSGRSMGQHTPADTGVLVLAGGAVGPAADAELDLAPLEVA